MDNRRREERFRIRLAGRIQVEGFRHRMQTENLSTSGVRISLDAPLLEGAQVDVNLSLVKRDSDEAPVPFSSKGDVIWCNEDMEVGYQAGIRFAGQNDSGNSGLSTFLSDCTPI